MPYIIDTENQKIIETIEQPDIVSDFTMQGCLDNISRCNLELNEMENAYNVQVAAKNAEKQKYQDIWDAGIDGGLDNPIE